ncbi:MAG: fibronectin type III domain-containing protein [Thermoplasmata archaeon]|nr:fibronectin type III domain-containing protein [Thermoplasmata archaeon]
MPSPPHSRSALLLTTALLASVLLLAPAGAWLTGVGTPTGSPSVASHGGSNPAVVPAAPARPASTVSAGGRLFTTHDTDPLGVSQPGLIATDNVSGTVYSANIFENSSIVVAFDGWTGAFERSIDLTNASSGYSIVSIAFDNLSDELYVGLAYGGPSLIAVLSATSFAWITNITFAGSSNPDFVPFQELFEFHTNQLLVENHTIDNVTDDVAAINTTTNTIGLWMLVECDGPSLDDGCYAVYSMFEMLDSADEWLVVLPDQSNLSFVLVPDVDIADDLVGGAFAAPNGFFFGPGAYFAAFSVIYFINASGNGDLTAYSDTGTLIVEENGSAPGIPESLTDDPSAGWLALTAENLSSPAPGALFDLINPLELNITTQLQNASLPFYDTLDEAVPFDAPNGTGYFVTSGYSFGGPTGELIQLLNATPYAAVVATYSANINPEIDYAVPTAFDASLGLAYEVATSYYISSQVWAIDTATGAIAWTATLPGLYPAANWVTTDVADGIVYVGGGTDSGPWIVALSAATGALDGNFPMTYLPVVVAFGSGHLLYATDQSNGTIQVYSNSGGADTLVWDETIALPVGSDPCTLAVSPVAAYVADEDCLTGTVQLSSATSGMTVANFSESTDGWAAAFNATGALFVGNDTPTGTVAIYAAPSWGLVRTLVSPVPVDYLGFVAPLGAVAVGGFYTAVVLLNTSTGHAVATLPQAPGADEYAAADPATGTVTEVGTTGVTMIANLVPLPSVAGGLAIVSGNSTLNATWSASTGAGGYPVTGYTVYTGPAAAGPWTQAATTTTATSVTVTGLSDGTTYYVTVRANSGSGTGPAAPPVSGVPAGVPYPPTGLTVTGPTGSTLAVAWGAPSSDGGLTISSYTVLYATSASGPWMSASAGTQTNATLTSLASSTTYYVKVEAANAAGTGHASATVSAATTSSSSKSGSSLLSGSGLWIVIGILVLVVIVALVAAMMMMRRGKTGGSPPTGSPPGVTGPPATPPSGAPGGSPPPPPGAQ